MNEVQLNTKSEIKGFFYPLMDYIAKEKSIYIETNKGNFILSSISFGNYIIEDESKIEHRCLIRAYNNEFLIEEIVDFFNSKNIKVEYAETLYPNIEFKSILILVFVFTLFCLLLW